MSPTTSGDERGRLFVMLSGRGSNFLALCDHIKKGDLRAEIVGVLSNKASAKGVASAEELGIKTYVVPHKGLERREHELAVEAIIDEIDPDLIVLAGYMRILTPDFVKKYYLKLINIHPALLPSFPGVHAQQQAFDYGVKISGCSVHFVDEGVDSGPVILQKAVPVHDDDDLETLSARILEQEHRAYAEAVQIVLDGGWTIEGRRFIRG